MLSKFYTPVQTAVLAAVAATLNLIPGVAATTSPYVDDAMEQDVEPVQHTGETWADAEAANRQDPASADTNQA